MIRIGIIGAGPNATGHVKYYVGNPRTKVVAVADPDQERARKLAADASAEPLADYTQFLDRVDAVVISSPNFLHKDHAIACARAGKHVYCEKPMGISRAEAGEIAVAVNQAKVKSAVGFAVHFDPTIQTMLRLVREDKIGKIVSVCSRRLCYSTPVAKGWRSDHNLSGGLLMELNVHELEWMMAVAGEVKSVYARMAAENPVSPRSNDHLWFILNYASGAEGIHEGSWRAPTAAYFREVFGVKGGAHTDEWGQYVFYGQAGQKDREKLPCDPQFDLRGHFLDCIEHGSAPVADVNWGLKVMTVAEALFQSATSGQIITIQ